MTSNKITEERWLTFPMAKKLELFSQFEQLETLMEKQIELRKELRRALLRKWMSHEQSQPSSVNFTEKNLLKFVRKYYECLHDDVEQFEFEGHTFLVAYAKYVIEYLEPQIVAVSKHSFVNNAERVLRDIRRNHDIRMKIKTDPTYCPPPSYRQKG